MKTIKLLFVGDFCSKPSSSKIIVSDELKEMIRSCDLKVVNFEVPLKPEVKLPPQKKERFYQNEDAPNFLLELGFNLFSMANNHAFDWGEEGFKKTKRVLGDAAFGAGTYEEAYKVKVAEIDGIKIGFFALSFAAYTGVFNDVTDREGLGCAYINDLRVNHDIINAKRQVDYLFVLPHDGIEYIDVPTLDIIARYRDFIDYGADGVIGTHPHCPQGWEDYKGKPIFYSLGNFLFNSKEDYDYRATLPHWYEGLCVVLSICDGRVSWQVVNTRNVNNTGIVVDHDGSRERHNRQLCEYLEKKESYHSYFDTICAKLAQKDLAIVDRTFHPNTLKECTRLLLKHWKSKIKGQDFTDDFPLQRLLDHDSKRNLLRYSLKYNNSSNS